MLYNYKKINILNKTDLPKGLLHKIIDLTRPKQLKVTPFNLLIIYRHNYKKTLSKLFIGKNIKLYYPFGGLAMSTSNGPLVIVNVARKFYPSYTKKNKKMGYLKYKINDKTEHFVSTLSHEFRHLINIKRRIKNSPKQETICDRYAMKMLKRWRKP
jgi:hypothetical protein